MTLVPASSHGGASAPLTLTGTDPVSAPQLSVVASPDQTAGTDTSNLTEVRDADGNLLWSTEYDGGTRHVWDFRVQPLTEPSPTFAVAPSGAATWAVSGVAVGSVNPIPSIGSPVLLFSAPDGRIAIQVYGDATGAANAIEVFGLPDFDLVFAVTATGGIKATLPTSNPGPGLLWNDTGTVKVGT